MNQPASPVLVAPPALGTWRTYRLWSVDRIPFDAVPTRAQGGPSLAVIDGWRMSLGSLCRALSTPGAKAADDGMFTLSLTRSRSGTLAGPWERHRLDGRKFTSKAEADRAVYEAGCTAFMVYDIDAAKFGLPTTPPSPNGPPHHEHHRARP